MAKAPKQIDMVKLYARKNCLVVDDMSEVRGSLMRILRNFGVNDIDTVATGEEAVEYCRHKNYDVVLCDYNLGAGKDGQQILEELRHFKLLKNTALFVMITAESSRTMVLAALEYQPDEYLTKPITPALLRSRLDRALLRHESLIDIKGAMDNDDYQTALGLCADKLNNNPRYEATLKKMQAELYFKTGDYDSAGNVYDAVLKEKSSIWAQLGAAKTELAKTHYPQAIQSFEKIVDADPRYIEAYDLLAQAHQETGDYEQAQTVMADGVAMSPKSVLRQRKLAGLARHNQDRHASIKAFKGAIKLGFNSCYESSQDYLDLAQECTSACGESDEKQARQYEKEADTILQKAEKRYGRDKNVTLQTTSARSRLHAVRERVDQAKQAAATAKRLYQELGEDLKPEAGVDFAHALVDVQDDSADAVLSQLLKEFGDDDAIAERLDNLSDEPISSKGRDKVAAQTKKGIGYYEQKHYGKAVGVFRSAIRLFPKHVGLNLNLLQAVLADTKQNGTNNDYRDLCHQALRDMPVLDEQHSQCARYEYLKEQIEQFYPESGPMAIELDL